MRRLSESRRRRGTVLVWFALMVWVFLGLAALTIDLGLVRVTQRQMLSLTDEAAMEAAYSLGGMPSDRQVAAQNAILEALNDTQTNDAQRFGAGPQIDFTGGISLEDGFSAAETLSISNPRVYQPTLAVNASNAEDGDIVQGTYTVSATTANPEANGYSRADFTPSTSGNAILVRLRRSNEQFAAGDASRSNGPPLPYLFARGSLLSAQAKGQGVTVRATSIAAARPVLSAGPKIPAQSLPGVAPFGLLLSSWQTWRANPANQTATILTASVDMSTGVISGNVTGAFTMPVTQPTTIGQTFSPAPQAPTSPQNLDRYVPLYDSNNRIVGFLHAFDSTTNTVATVASGSLTMPISAALAPGNASPTLPPLASTATNPLAGLASTDLSNLFSFTNTAVSSGSTDPLRAPALVR